MAKVSPFFARLFGMLGWIGIRCFWLVFLVHRFWIRKSWLLWHEDFHLYEKLFHKILPEVSHVWDSCSDKKCQKISPSTPCHIYALSLLCVQFLYTQQASRDISNIKGWVSYFFSSLSPQSIAYVIKSNL